MVERNYGELLDYARRQLADPFLRDPIEHYYAIIEALERGDPVFIDVKLENWQNPKSEPIKHSNSTGNLGRALSKANNRFNRRYGGLDDFEVHRHQEVRLRVGDLSVQII